MRQIYNKIVLLLCFFSLSLMLSAQIKGVVIDSLTNEPIAYISVFYEGKGVGGITNEQGEFTIDSRKGWNQVTFSAVGYTTKVVPILPGVTKTLHVKLSSTDIQLAEVIIKPKKEKYSRKDNPAVELMRKVIANKSNRTLEENDFYQYDKYQKMTMALNDVTPEMLDKGIYKKIPFLKDQIEVCHETNKLILPISVQETASQKFYRKEPKSEKVLVKGINSNGIEDLFTTGEMLGTVLNDVFSDINIYDNDIRLLQTRFVSPISSTSAISFYQFFIMDTLYVDKDPCIHLTFVPQNSQDFGFTGHLYVLNDSTYAVKKCVMNLPKKTGVNFVENLHIVQEYKQLPTGNWVLINDDMIAELYLLKALQGMQIRRVTKYNNYTFDKVPAQMFRLKGDVVKESNAMMMDDKFWSDVRQVPLTQTESTMDQFVKRMEKIPGFKYIIFVAKAFIENFVETGTKAHPSKFDFGPINTTISTNHVDGLRLRLSGQTTANLHPQLFLSGYYAYGFKDERSKYKAEVEYSFNKKEYLPREYPKHSISASYQYDVMSPMDKFLKTDKDNVFVSWKTTTVDQMSYVRDAILKYEQELVSGFSSILAVKHSNDEPTGSLHYIRNNEDHTELHDITTFETSLFLRYAPGETYINTKQRRRPVSLDAPVFTLSHTVGIKDVLGGDFNYNLTEIGVFKRFWLSSWGKTDIYLKAGAQWNQVPFPLLILPAANLSYITQRETFNLINNMEFLNDRFASLDFTYDLNGKLFNRIPVIKKLKWREVIRFKALWGDLSDKNNPFLNPGNGDLFVFPMRDGQYTSHVMNPKVPYMEVSVGIHNIFKILHIEYVRRLNYLDYPGVNKQGIRLMLMVTF